MQLVYRLGMTARFKSMGDLKAKLSGLGARAQELSPVTFRARVRLEQEERKAIESSEKSDAVGPRRFSRHFGSYSPAVF